MDTMKPVAWGAFRDGVLLPQSLTTDKDELRFEAAGTWIGCELRPLYALPNPEPDCVRWAEGLIRQLPDTHDGRNWWLAKYGEGPRDWPEPKPVAWTDKIGLEYLALGYGIDVSAEAGSTGRKIPLYASPLPAATASVDEPVASSRPAAAVTVDEEMVKRARLEFSKAVLDPAASVDEMWRRTLTAALSAAREVVRVKPLEWVATDPQGSRFRGRAVVGLDYFISVMVHGQLGERWKVANGDHYATLDAAIAVVNAHYEARVLSALQLTNIDTARAAE